MNNHLTETERFWCVHLNKNRIGMTTGILLILMFTPEKDVLAWTSGKVAGGVNIGGSIASSQHENRWQVMVGDGVQTLDMIQPKEGNIARIRLAQTLPVLGIRTTVGPSETIYGEDAGTISPQITFAGLLPGPRDKGRLPIELDVTRALNGSYYLGRLRMNLLAGAEVSQRHTITGEGRRYSVYASVPGEAFHGGIARTPDEAVDDAVSQVGEVFPEYISHYNTQGFPAIPRVKQSVEFRNSQMQYSGFYGAGLLRGDEIIMLIDPDAGISSTETWKASMRIMVAYQ